MGKVTSCFGSSKFLMTFRFVAQPPKFPFDRYVRVYRFLGSLDCFKRTLGARDFSCSVSGFGQVFLRARTKSFVGQDSADDLSDTKASLRNTKVA